MGARVAFQTIGELGIVRSEQSLVARYRRGRAEIARSPVSYYSVHLHLAGSGFLRLCERELAIAKGDIFVTDTLNEFEMGFPGSSIMVAKVPGVSTRLLHRVFAERNTTLMTYVWRERVGCVAKLLANLRAEHRSITEIAFACGFSDSTHFGRAFAAAWA